MPVFHQLERDMADIDTAMLTRSTSPNKATLTRIGKSKKRFEAEAKKLAEWLDANRTVDPPVWNSAMWAVNYEGMLKWRVERGKNLNRDFDTLATVALIEQETVAVYRPKLLKTSAAAQWLRQEFHNAISANCQHWKSSKLMASGKRSVVKVNTFRYPDGISTDTIEKSPYINVRSLKKHREIANFEKQAIADLAALLTKFQRSRLFRATPGTPWMNDEVREALDVLAQVCTLYGSQCCCNAF
jgi:hypothetical protein